MPRILSRSILREIKKSQLIPLEILDVSTEAPFTSWGYRFVNNIESVSVGGIIYTPLGFNRGNFESESGEAVDRLTITLDDAGKFWALAVQRNIFQGARVRLRKIFMGYTANERDAITIFDGFLGAPTFDDATLAVEARSVVAYQETELPPRTFQPNCPFQLGSERCGVDMTAPENRINGVVGGPGSSRGILRSMLLSPFPPRYFDAGYVYCTDGTNAGVVRPIKTNGIKGSQGFIELVVPFAFSTEGGKYRVVRGCRKTKADCDRFNNVNAAGRLRYGGFAEVPRTPAVEIAAT